MSHLVQKSGLGGRVASATAYPGRGAGSTGSGTGTGSQGDSGVTANVNFDHASKGGLPASAFNTNLSENYCEGGCMPLTVFLQFYRKMDPHLMSSPQLINDAVRTAVRATSLGQTLGGASGNRLEGPVCESIPDNIFNFKYLHFHCPFCKRALLAP